jgi:hypothetical protein
LGDGAAAAVLLRRAAAIYRLRGEEHQQGRTLQKLALAVGYDDPPQGVEIAEQALALVEPGREPRVELAARHLLVWFLNDCGMSWHRSRSRGQVPRRASPGSGRSRRGELDPAVLGIRKSSLPERRLPSIPV